MNADEAFEGWHLNSRAGTDAISKAELELGCSLPRDYLEFISEYNGGEGFVGDNYLIVWGVDELVGFNRDYEVDEYAPGIILFGSDGGGEGYGFDRRDTKLPIVRVPFIGMSLTYVETIADDFSSLLEFLRQSA
ncbi:SMI1/KNR4 family protein [Pseudomonas wadenswilerensis]